MRLLIRVALALIMLGTVAAAHARGQDEFGAILPGIASFQPTTLRSSVPLVAVVSFVSLVMGLAVMFTRRPARAQLTPSEPESGLHRAQRAAAIASVTTLTAARPPFKAYSL
jgi:hypothetical protein